MFMCSYIVLTFDRSLILPQSPASAESFGLNPEQKSCFNVHHLYIIISCTKYHSAHNSTLYSSVMLLAITSLFFDNCRVLSQVAMEVSMTVLQECLDQLQRLLSRERTETDIALVNTSTSLFL